MQSALYAAAKTSRASGLSCAYARYLVRKPDAGDPHVRFDERDLEIEYHCGVTAPDLDSTAPMVSLLSTLFRAGFEPLSLRGECGCSLRIEGRSLFWAVPQPMPRLKTGADWRGKGTGPWARRVFRPTVPGFVIGNLSGRPDSILDGSEMSLVWVMHNYCDSYLPVEALQRSHRQKGNAA